MKTNHFYNAFIHSFQSSVISYSTLLGTYLNMFDTHTECSLCKLLDIEVETWLVGYVQCHSTSRTCRWNNFVPNFFFFPHMLLSDQFVQLCKYYLKVSFFHTEGLWEGKGGGGGNPYYIKRVPCFRTSQHYHSSY